jgi:hypothetical integral membrane protein (TIGR02206 family)
MSPLQIAALAFTFLAPLAVWLVDRRVRSPRVLRAGERSLAVLLVVGEVTMLVLKVEDGTFTLAEALPMHLCDLGLVLISAALWWHWRTGFEIAYFWGLAGTFQALLTPAIPPDLYWLRAAGFFFLHAGIVVGIIHLLLTQRWRPTPGSLVKVIAASELYLAIVLAVNALTGGNYGFLAHQPPTASMLDLFSRTHWLYVVQLNLTAFAFFAALYAPWFLADLISRKGRATPPAGNP